MTTFDDILGQDRAIETLRRAFQAARLPHGLVFGGPAGVGKGTAARALGGLFLCELPKGTNPCGKCAACLAMAAGSHPDYHVITKELIRYYDKSGKSKATTLSIDVIRPELIEKASRKAVMGKGKVFVVRDADLMMIPAQNALLKTLEEPAGRTLIIMLTDQPEALLSTIRSRTQLVRFGFLPDDVVRNELRKHGMTDTDAAEAARFARGSIGLALKWHTDGVLSNARQLVGLFDLIFAGGPTDELWDWFKSAADGYAAKQLERDPLSSKDQATREGLSLYLRIAGDHLRAKLSSDNPDEIERAADAIEAIAKAQDFLDSNVNIPLVFQQLSVSLTPQRA
jgi:DNA polymerase-3 subunit delta'